MDDQRLLRYSRQIMLPQIDLAGQQRLFEARVLLVGVGGLGAPAAMYLAASGVGRLVLCDGDTVDLANLQRQIVFATGDIGRPKSEAAREALARLNPDVRTIALGRRLDGALLGEEVAAADVVVDATDNFTTRFALNEACMRAGRPLVSGAAIRMAGQVSVFDPRRADSPCYRCLYPEMDEVQERCAQTGILGPVAGMVGCMQATEAVKIVLGVGETLVGRLVLIDALDMEIRTVKVRRDPQCPVCRERGRGATDPV